MSNATHYLLEHDPREDAAQTSPLDLHGLVLAQPESADAALATQTKQAPTQLLGIEDDSMLTMLYREKLPEGVDLSGAFVTDVADVADAFRDFVQVVMANSTQGIILSDRDIEDRERRGATALTALHEAITNAPDTIQSQIRQFIANNLKAVIIATSQSELDIDTEVTALREAFGATVPFLYVRKGTNEHRNMRTILADAHEKSKDELLGLWQYGANHYAASTHQQPRAHTAMSAPHTTDPLDAAYREPHHGTHPDAGYRQQPAEPGEVPQFRAALPVEAKKRSAEEIMAAIANAGWGI